MNKKKLLAIITAILVIVVFFIIFYVLATEWSERKVKPLPPLSQDFEQAMVQFNGAERLMAYLNQYFRIENRANVNPARGLFAFYAPEEFFQKRRGEKQDFAILISYVLHRKGYESSILQYQYYVDARNPRVETLVLFRDDAPKYFFFQDEKLILAEYDGIIENLLAAEEERLNIEILIHHLWPPGFIRLIRQEE